jgi:adenosylmethionine-8-amino-7-oxononanoate aminotransferase
VRAACDAQTRTTMSANDERDEGAPRPATAAARESAQVHLLPHFTKGAAWRSQSLPIICKGEGCYVEDTDGNRYLDGLAGLFCTNIGHGRKDLAAAAAAQMEKLAFFHNWGFATPPTIEAASMIAGFAPNDLSEVFFVNSGSEAVESAVKFARNYHWARGDDRRFKVIARDWAYHGTTLGALSVTGIPKFRKPFLPLLWDGVLHVPHTHDPSVAAVTPADELPCVKSLEAQILKEGPESVSLVIAEPVQNGRGAVVPPAGYWQELRRICDKHGILLCADEVICGFGRLGHWFASERFGADPDIITFAKGVTSAYQPLGGFVTRKRLVDETWDSDLGMYSHGSTFGGHPVACAVAVANMSAMRDERVLDNVRANEAYFQEHLDRLVDGHDAVKEWRGCGYFYALELVESRARGAELCDKDRAALQGGVLGKFVHESGLIVRPDDRGATMLVLSPPLIADRDVLDDIMVRMDQILTRTDAWIADSAASRAGAPASASVTTRPTGSLIEDRPRSLSPVSSECGSEAAEEGKGHLVSVPPAVAVAEK